MLGSYDQSVVIGLFTGHWDYPDWYADGKCQGMSWDAFFGPANETDTQLIGPGVLHRAQRICGSCPVKESCLEYALRKHIQHGIWAGTSGRTRARIWAMERRGEVTRAEVLADFSAGRRERYEHLPRRRSDVSLNEPMDARLGQVS